MIVTQVHDLVRLEPTIAQRWPDADAWVGESLRRAPWAVVRRERSLQTPIGIRGTSRRERYAAVVSGDDVACVVTPADLRDRVTRATVFGDTFADLNESAQLLGVRIAPVGSYGFELASGVRTTNASSDLDLLIHADGLGFSTLVAFGRLVDRAAVANGVRIDVELAYADGGVALREVLALTPKVLFKTATGPQLLPCPR